MARLFDATTDQITFGTTSLPPIGTISMWVYPLWAKTDGQNHMFFSAQADAAFVAQILKFSNNNIYAGFYISSVEYRVVVTSANYTLVQNAWNHIGFTWNDTTNLSVLYTAGVSSGTNSALGSFVTTHTKTIGNEATEGANDYNFNGRIAEVAVYNIDLSAAEIAALARGYAPPLIRVQNIVDYLPLIREVQDLRGIFTAVDFGTSAAEHPRMLYRRMAKLRLHTAVAGATQEGYRWRDDDGSETTASWLGSQDTNINRGKLETTRLRILTDNSGNPPSEALKLQYRKLGDPDWLDVN